MNEAYLSTKFLDDIRDNPTWDVYAMQKKMQRTLGHEVSIAKCYRAKRRCKKIIEGDIKEQYRRLWDYAETVRKTNPGSLVKLKTELGEEAATEVSRVPKHITIFHYIYMRLEALKQGYFSGIRPVIGLDGCHLKTSMGGQMLCVVARDGNENIFPLHIHLWI